MMRFIYLGEAELDQEDLERFLEAAKELEIKGLTENFSTGDEEMNHESLLNMKDSTEIDIIREEPYEISLEVITDVTESYLTNVKSEIIDLTSLTKSKKESKAPAPGSNNLECDECMIKFSGTGALLNHKRNKHEGVRYSCGFCEFNAGQAGNLRRHISKHHSK